MINVLGLSEHRLALKRLGCRDCRCGIKLKLSRLHYDDLGSDRLQSLREKIYIYIYIWIVKVLEVFELFKPLLGGLAT